MVTVPVGGAAVAVQQVDEGGPLAVGQGQGGHGDGIAFGQDQAPGDEQPRWGSTGAVWGLGTGFRGGVVHAAVQAARVMVEVGWTPPLTLVVAAGQAVMTLLFWFGSWVSTLVAHSPVAELGPMPVRVQKVA